MRDRKTGKRLIARHLRSIVPGPLCLTGSATALQLLAHPELGYPVKRTSYIDYSAVKTGRTLIPPQWDFCCVSPLKLYRCDTHTHTYTLFSHDECARPALQLQVLPRQDRWLVNNASALSVADCTLKWLGFRSPVLKDPVDIERKRQCPPIGGTKVSPLFWRPPKRFCHLSVSGNLGFEEVPRDSAIFPFNGN